MQVNYTVIINSSNSDLGGNFILTDELQFSIQFLEMAFRGAAECEAFSFYVQASVAGTEDSVPAVVIDTVPLCKCMLW